MVSHFFEDGPSIIAAACHGKPGLTKKHWSNGSGDNGGGRDRLVAYHATGFNAMTAPDAVQRETILLVDDEQSVRAIVVKILRRANYVVLEAEDGAAALRISGHPLCFAFEGR